MGTSPGDWLHTYSFLFPLNITVKQKKRIIEWFGREHQTWFRLCHKAPTQIQTEQKFLYNQTGLLIDGAICMVISGRKWAE